MCQAIIHAIFGKAFVLTNFLSTWKIHCYQVSLKHMPTVLSSNRPVLMFCEKLHNYLKWKLKPETWFYRQNWHSLVTWLMFISGYKCFSQEKKAALKLIRVTCQTLLWQCYTISPILYTTRLIVIIICSLPYHKLLVKRIVTTYAGYVHPPQKYKILLVNHTKNWKFLVANYSPYFPKKVLMKFISFWS